MKFLGEGKGQGTLNSLIQMPQLPFTTKFFKLFEMSPKNKPSKNSDVGDNK